MNKQEEQEVLKLAAVAKECGATVLLSYGKTGYVGFKGKELLTFVERIRQEQKEKDKALVLNLTGCLIEMK